LRDNEFDGSQVVFKKSVVVARYCALFTLLFGQTALPQVVGSMVMERHTFTAGDPIDLRFQVSNTGRNSVQLAVSDLYGPCGSPFHVKVRSTSSLSLPRRFDKESNEHEFIESCSYGGRLLEPGRKYTEHFTLTRDNEQLRHPGSYHIEVTRYLSYDRRNVLPHVGSPLARFDSEFDVIVEKSPPEKSAR
jgi:hypothetical protein